ncbi:hypothetical protein AAC387_Pa01g2444 [Persea americana]
MLPNRYAREMERTVRKGGACVVVVDWVVEVEQIVMSEDMVKDGYEDIMNIDISPVAIDMMRKKYENIPHLKYMQMDVRDMSFFPDESFDSVIDKGTLDSLMITYGDPTVRIPHLNRQGYGWKIILHIICEFLLRKDLS